MKKIVKLINDERINTAVLSNKATGCIEGASDVCIQKDVAKCDTYAYDYCSKADRASCFDGANDICTYDYALCHGPGEADRCYEDSI